MALNKTRAGREYENVLKFFVVINNPIAGSPVFIKIRISCIRDAYFYQCMYCLSRISEKIVGGVYCTKFELILKAIPTNRTREARGGSKLNRTLNESPATASLHSASIRTRFCENYFLGIWIFAKPRLICFLHFVRAEEGSGEESARASLSDFFGGGLKLLQRFYKTVGECLSCFHWFSE